MQYMCMAMYHMYFAVAIATNSLIAMLKLCFKAGYLVKANNKSR